MTGTNDSVSLAIDGPDGSATVELPEELLETLAGPDDSSADVVADVTMLSCAQRVHEAVHGTEGDAGDDLRALEERMHSLFESQFGSSFSDVTGLDVEGDGH